MQPEKGVFFLFGRYFRCVCVFECVQGYKQQTTTLREKWMEKYEINENLKGFSLGNTVISKRSETVWNSSISVYIMMSRT